MMLERQQEGTTGAKGRGKYRNQQHEHSRTAEIATRGRWRAPGRNCCGFSNTPLDTVLRKYGRHDLCRFWSDHLRLRVNDHPRWVEYNYRMILVSDAVAEVDRTTHEAELTTMARIFADVKTTDEVIRMLGSIRS